MFFAEAQRLLCLRGTILGREVVPEVCRTKAMSSGSANPLRAGVPELPPFRVKMPADR
jgi:hypothetical protein